MSDVLTSMGINIIEIITDTKNAPITGATIFQMMAKINLDTIIDEELIKKLAPNIVEGAKRLKEWVEKT